MTQATCEDDTMVHSRWLLPGVRLRTAIGLTVLVVAMLSLAIVSTLQPLLTASPLPARIVFLVVAVAGLPFCLAAWRLRRVEIALEDEGVRIGHIIGSRLTPWGEITLAERREGVFGVRVVLRSGDEQLDDTVLNGIFEARADEVVAAINARLPGGPAQG